MTKIAKLKLRTHNEWFFPISLNNRKSCPECKAKLLPGEWIWGWYEYRNFKKRLLEYFCQACWPTIAQHLNDHIRICGCEVTLKICGAPEPDWLVLPPVSLACCQSMST